MPTFATTAMDPPWHEPGGCDRGSDDQYETHDRHDILAAIVSANCWAPAKDAHLWMWTTMTSLLDGIWLMDALGFTYKTHGIWVKSDGVDLVGDLKLTIGLGQYLRGAHEIYLLGTRGRGFAVRTDLMNIPSVMVAPVPRDEKNKRIHSAKPEAFYKMVEARSRGPYLEMFSRKRREGWHGWGREYPQEAA